MRTQPDALLQLPQIHGIETLVQLRLANQEDLQQFRLSCFQICQQTNLFQQRGRQMVRFVDDQDGSHSLTMTSDGKAAQFEEKLSLVLTRRRQTKIARDVLQKLSRA